MAIATGFWAPSLFEVVGRFPGCIIGQPYDQELDLSGVYQTPLSADALGGIPPPGLVLEMSVDGLRLRLHGTPLPPISLDGRLPGYLVGVPYYATLSVSGLGSETLVSGDIYAGAMPSWMSVTLDSVNSLLIFSGTPI